MRLPAGNQSEVLATLHRDDLTAAELDGVVDLLLAAQASRSRSTSWPSPVRLSSKCSMRADGPGTLDSAKPAIACQTSVRCPGGLGPDRDLAAIRAAPA